MRFCWLMAVVILGFASGKTATGKSGYAVSSVFPCFIWIWSSACHSNPAGDPLNMSQLELWLHVASVIRGMILGLFS